MTSVALDLTRVAALAAAALLAAPTVAADEVVILQSGARIEGSVVKKTAETVFVDIGHTILSIPAKEIQSVQNAEEARKSAESSAAKPSAERHSLPDAAPQKEDIFFRARLSSGSIKEKAREVAEGVVQIVCPGKLGSGFIINDAEGFVVTNCHVVEADHDIAVMVYIREEQDFKKVRLENVRIVALNPFFDLALLKIELDGSENDGKGMKLKKVFLGETSVVRDGDPVFAVGSPLGLERTVTEGIISTTRRPIGGLVYLQTSAPINPGNSGGPLFNDRGEVIGVNSLKASFGESLGFSIPVDDLKGFLRHREAFAFDKNQPNTGIHYFQPPRKAKPPGAASAEGARKL